MLKQKSFLWLMHLHTKGPFAETSYFKTAVKALMKTQGFADECLGDVKHVTLLLYASCLLLLCKYRVKGSTNIITADLKFGTLIIIHAYLVHIN
jgi:hypothetical protein